MLLNKGAGDGKPSDTGHDARLTQWHQFVITLLLIGTIYCILWIVANQRVPANNRDMFIFLMGSLFGLLAAPLASMFPSNVSSAKKDDTANRLAMGVEALAQKTPPTTVPVEEITPQEKINANAGTSGSSAPDIGEHGARSAGDAGTHRATALDFERERAEWNAAHHG